MTPVQEKQVYRSRNRRRHGHGGLAAAIAVAVICAVTLGVLQTKAAPARRAAGAVSATESTVETKLDALAPAAKTETKIVVAIDPGHGGVNPNIGAEDAGSEGSGLREADITLKTAQLVCEKLEADGRFAPILTTDGTEYRKPSRRAELAKAAGAELLLSIHLNYDADSSVAGFECYPATPQLATNADSLRFEGLIAEKFAALGLDLRGADGIRYIYFDANDNRYIRESTDATPIADPTFTIVQACGCPAVLVEEGFISNTQDVARIASDAGCEAAAQAYYDCILAYFDLQ